jgi:hypothetical protein
MQARCEKFRITFGSFIMQELASKMTFLDKSLVVKRYLTIFAPITNEQQEHPCNLTYRNMDIQQ